MTTSVLDVCNMALGSVRARAKLSSISDNSREAEVCSLFYELARNEMFSAAYWPTLRGYARLAKVAEQPDPFVRDGWTDADPLPQWRAAFALPADHHRPRYVEGHGSFEIVNLGGQLTLQTNAENPILVYTRRVDEPGLWGPELLSLVVAHLAYKIALPITGSANTHNLARDTAEAAYFSTMQLQANMEHPPMLEHIPDWIAARGAGIANSAPTTFFYPVQTLSFTHAAGKI